MLGTNPNLTALNIQLTRDGQIINWDFAPATAENIIQGGYLLADDPRCHNGLVKSEADIFQKLGPVLGEGFKGPLVYRTAKQLLIQLHGTAFLGYNRQEIHDPRIGARLATMWEIYLDTRIFPKAPDDGYFRDFGLLIAHELDDDEADLELANDIKDRLIQQVYA